MSDVVKNVVAVAGKWPHVEAFCKAVEQEPFLFKKLCTSPTGEIVAIFQFDSVGPPLSLERESKDYPDLKIRSKWVKDDRTLKGKCEWVRGVKTQDETSEWEVLDGVKWE